MRKTRTDRGRKGKRRDPILLLLVVKLQIQVDAAAHRHCHHGGERHRGRFDHVVCGAQRLDAEYRDVRSRSQCEVRDIVSGYLFTEIRPRH